MYCFRSYGWLGSEWSFEVHLDKQRCQNRMFLFLWALSCWISGQVMGRELEDGAAWMGLGIALWKQNHCKTNIAFSAWILMVQMGLDGVVPASKQTVYRLKSLCQVKERLKGLFQVFLWLELKCLYRQRRDWIQEPKRLQFEWHARAKLKRRTKPQEFNVSIRF